jgi:uncharacterized protein with ParB-like and HNH nuclease domain
MEIKADVKSIEKLKDYFFIVPDYQREYVWESEKHVARFLQDINDEFNPTTSKQSSYFIGSAIIVKKGNGAYDVVDGQQRLTTIIISLCAIRAILKSITSLPAEQKNSKEKLLSIVQNLLFEYSIEQDKNTPRLILQYSESKDYLTKLIEEVSFEDRKTNSIKRMEDAYNTIYAFLKDIAANDPATLIAFVRYFLLNVEMVIIQPDDLSSALKIFETINERGVGLNALDLLKNLLFSNASESDFAIIKDTWKQMIDNLSVSGEGDKPLRFLRYFLIARYHDGIIREEDIYKWIISKEGKEKIKYEQDPVKFARELLRASKKYSDFIRATNAWDADPDYPNITGIGYLSKKNARQHLILLLAIKDSLDKSTINILAKNLESLVFYYAINKVLTKYYETTFANWAVQIRKISSLDELKAFIKTEIGNELKVRQDTFAASFASKSQDDLNPQYRIKYVLGKIEEYIRSKVNFPSANLLFYQSQQLEHILPQTGENIPSDIYPNEYDYRVTKYKFGNLTLLESPINQSLNYSNDISSNEWFVAKKNAYLNSGILLSRTFSDITIGHKTAFNGFATEKLKSFDYWNMDAVSERQEILKKLILDIWKIHI